MGLLMACSLLSLPNSPPLVSYQGQLSSAQFGLVSCSEGDFLRDTRPGEVGKGVDKSGGGLHCEVLRLDTLHHLLCLLDFIPALPASPQQSSRDSSSSATHAGFDAGCRTLNQR